LESVKDRLRVFFFPPYAPEINPDDLGPVDIYGGDSLQLGDVIQDRD
jgi:hypothetical protein